MDIQSIMRIMDASSGTRRIIERSLHEIDRRALNAMVLVKRHGNKLASYGVVAQAFREQAVQLKNAAAPLQQSVAPLVRVQMRMLQPPALPRCSAALRRWRVRTSQSPHFPFPSGGTLAAQYRSRRSRRHDDSAPPGGDGHPAEEGITEQEYVVTNGRIEAALSEQSGAPLMRVSHEMGLAVAKVRDAIWKYRAELEEVLHESSAGI